MRRRNAHGRGNVAIEYGLVVPLLLMFVLGIMDVSRLLWSYTTLYRAVEAAARCAAINTTTCGNVAAIQNFAVTEAWGLTVAPSVFTVSTQACGIQVAASYMFISIIPGFNAADSPVGTVTLNATACYPT